MTTRNLTPIRTFGTEHGRTFAVRLVPAGGRYGRANVLVNDGAAMVEFYDTTYADDSDGDYGRPGGFGPLGQFVSRYFVETLLSGAQHGGLCLDGGYADVWTVDAEAMRLIRAWIRTTTLASTEAVDPSGSTP